MGKSSQKAATQVVEAAVVPVSKSTNKGGKREAENAIDKAVIAKKHKKDVVLVHKSSSEDDSSSDHDKPAPPETKTVVPPKKPAVAAKKEDSSSSSESSSDSDEDEKPVPKTRSGESSESSESSDEEEVPEAKAPSKLPQVAAKKGKKDAPLNPVTIQKMMRLETPAKVTAPSTKVAAPYTKKADSSSSDDSDSDDDEDATSDDSSDDSKDVKNDKPAVKAAQPSKSESDSDEDDDDDELPAKSSSDVVPAKATKMETISDEDEETSDEESEEDMKMQKKKDSDVVMVDAQSKSEKAPKNSATPGTSGSKTLFAGNLSFRIERTDVEVFFKNVGQVVEVRFSSDAEGTFRGYGHVEFATAEEAQKALELNGSDLCGRPVRLDIARERGERGAYTPHNGNEGNSYQKGGQAQSQTIFVRGFDTTQGEDEIRGALQSHFGSCGEITRVSIPKDYKTGAPKGMAYMDFSDPEALDKAFGLDGSDLGNGCILTVQSAKPKADFGGGGFDSGRGRGRVNRGRGRTDNGRGRGRSDNDNGRGRGPSLATRGTGKKITFNDE